MTRSPCTNSSTLPGTLRSVSASVDLQPSHSHLHAILLYVRRGWCERLIDVDYEDGEDHFRFVLSPGPTPATRVYIGRQKVFDPTVLPQPSSLSSLSSAGLTGSLEEPTTPIQRLDVHDGSAPITSTGAQVGDRIEVSPVGIALAQDLSKRIAQFGGGALIIDYGHDRPSELSLRGIKNHAFVSVLREPGDVDLVRYVWLGRSCRVVSSLGSRHRSLR